MIWMLGPCCLVGHACPLYNRGGTVSAPVSSLWTPVDFISLALCGLDCEEGADALGHCGYGRQEKVTDLAIVLLRRRYVRFVTHC